MKYNGISFNHAFWKGKTVEEFLAHERHHDLTTAQLKEAFGKINPKKATNADDKKPAIEDKGA